MKNLIIALGFLLMTSCQAEGELTKDPVTVIPPVITTPNNMVLKYSGEFVSSPGESVSGSAKIYLDKTNQLILENVIANGPDLKVYLSKTDSPVDFVNLGSLVKSKITYEIPSGIDVSNYGYVIIYCQQYSVKFGVSKLTKS